MFHYWTAVTICLIIELHSGGESHPVPQAKHIDLPQKHRSCNTVVRTLCVCMNHCVCALTPLWLTQLNNGVQSKVLT